MAKPTLLPPVKESLVKVLAEVPADVAAQFRVDMVVELTMAPA